MLGTHREDALGSQTHALYLTPDAWAKESPAEQAPGVVLARLCKIQDLEFMASWNDLGPTPYPPVRPPDAPANRVLRLYRCPGRSRSHAPN